MSAVVQSDQEQNEAMEQMYQEEMEGEQTDDHQIIDQGLVSLKSIDFSPVYSTFKSVSHQTYHLSLSNSALFTAPNTSPPSKPQVLHLLTSKNFRRRAIIAWNPSHMRHCDN